MADELRIDNELLDRVQRRVLWLAVQQVHYANHVRPRDDALKVGGHQASCASVVTLMTMLFFEFMREGDLLSVKPHASPVFHAIQFLLGRLDGSYLKRLREVGGLQSYPSRKRDPDQVDFSTGSVGLGAVAPNFASIVHTYLRTHSMGGTAPRRFLSLVGDAELDEGSVWEAVAEPAMAGAEALIWIVDLNRQSLDRVIPGIRVRCWREMFAANGWEVIDAKYGRRLEDAFAEPNGELLRICIDELSNDAYQRLLRLPPAQLREWLPRKSRYPRDMRRLLDRWDDARLQDVFWNLGGHDFDVLRAAYARAAARSRPAVVFAYTLKGWRLPSVGHPQNHGVLLTHEQIESLRAGLGIAESETWSRFEPGTPEADLCESAARRLNRSVHREPAARIESPVPTAVSLAHKDTRSTQQTFGALLVALSRECPELAKRVVTVSPDVASSTNLGGWISKHQVWQLSEPEELPHDQTAGILEWSPSPTGQHIELGISENNLFLMLGQLGLSDELLGQPLIPIGTIYDPFIRRGLDALFYSLYSGAKFVMVGTPSGVTLAAEGGIHQSVLTASIGAEMPELASYEPCFSAELEWILMDALRAVRDRQRSTYLRLTTKPVDQRLFTAPERDADRESLRRQVLAGAYRLRDDRGEPGYAPGSNVVNLFACGAVVPEALAARDALRRQGRFVNVVNVTGPGPLFADYRRAATESAATGRSARSLLDALVPAEDRGAPVVTVVDAHPHMLAWIGAALGSRGWPLGVAGFGQSGSLPDVYRAYGIDASTIEATCLAALRAD
ncbi:MAG: pyruvate dehydrogenase [Planctomycetes bacterium]|nr:pyruvate dehydrogenase [Planctomycetota bacterium]